MKIAITGIALALLMGSQAVAAAPAAFSRYIVVDQFGYTPQMQKLAIVRDPVTGFDAKQHFQPGRHYAVVNADTGTVVYTGAPVPWRNGATDESSGDRTWSFDFSAVTTQGDYVVRDADNGETSARFTIGANPYRQVLIQAVRFFYYQRANFAKAPPFTPPAWASKADHLGPGQDQAARYYRTPDDAASARDLHGGWWDAGDFNRYTNWHSRYLIALLQIYSENPAVFTDDFNIPESGNGIPDLIDEVKFGMDWLCRMQQPDGSVLAVISTEGSSPPDASTHPSYYGGPSTSASYSAAAAFAYGAKVMAAIPALKPYAAELRGRAERAWKWAEAHPDVRFFNTDPPDRKHAIAAGEQEMSPDERPLAVARAAIYLFALTGAQDYETRLLAVSRELPLIKSDYVSVFQSQWLEPQLYYASLPNADTQLAAAFRSGFAKGFARDIYAPAAKGENPYRAYLPAWVWGSTRDISNQGNYFLDVGADESVADAARYAADYLHYLHGMNPLAKVYLSNMGAFGAENSVDEFFHSWFAKDSPWSNAKTSLYGPPPGYLVGGPNPHYNWALSCPGISPKCGSAPPSPPFGQPAQKSYADFGDGWPIDSWEITEPDGGYQVAYIRLLAHFVAAP